MLTRIPQGIAVFLIQVYQRYLSGLKMGSTCRFEPSCSAYALEVFTHRGFMVGLVLTFTRLIKCGPWHPGGYDPPPYPPSEDNEEFVI